MFTKNRIFAGIVLMVLLAVAAFALSSNEGGVQPRTRDAYKQLDLSRDQSLASSDPTYHEAVSYLDSWIDDPIRVALQTANYPNADNSVPDQLFLFRTGASSVTVVIVKDKLLDDSIRAKEIRVDLVKQNGTWQIEWVGGRWQCQRGFEFGWTTALCS